jgi:hypothetical protein
MSKYFLSSLCVFYLLFFSCKRLLYSCLAIYRVLIFLFNVLFPYIPVKSKVVQIWPGQTVTCLHTNRPGHIWTTLYVSHLLSLNIMDIFPYERSFLFLLIAMSLLLTTLFRFFLEQHSICNFLPQEKINSLYSVNELFSGNFANIFCLLISLHLSFTNLNISFQLHSCCFLHTNANPILCTANSNIHTYSHKCLLKPCSYIVRLIVSKATLCCMGEAKLRDKQAILMFSPQFVAYRNPELFYVDSDCRQTVRFAKTHPVKAFVFLVSVSLIRNMN